ncbi:MAG: hypothetical protein HKO76_04750 [Acidimicrobiia bacterium]|nr:hypothetical protein [Acidimicrobiia bacterium]
MEIDSREEHAKKPALRPATYFKRKEAGPQAGFFVAEIVNSGSAGLSLDVVGLFLRSFLRLNRCLPVLSNRLGSNRTVSDNTTREKTIFSNPGLPHRCTNGIDFRP